MSAGKPRCCERCGVEIVCKQKIRDKAKYCSRKCFLETVRKPRSCLRCGMSITRPRGNKRADAGKYCSKKCYFDSVRQGEHQFKGRVQDAWARLFDWFVEWELQRPSQAPCGHCGKTLYGHHAGKPAAFCSRRCEHRSNHPLPTSCRDCGCSLAGVTSCCRRRCDACVKKRMAGCKGHYRTRCRRYGVEFDRTLKRKEVFERDLWVCQSCGMKCLRSFKLIDGIPHPLSATVDHIVPLSHRKKGHTRDNVQCMCWKCNITKGSKASGQMRLMV